ncbi:MAG: Maltose phosphorylase [Mycobacterium sp.]|jgi:alpha,alpha-trehalose phosphorylase|nr:Maltose phosphorylase [Mycobacterium sp.]
MRRHDAFPVEPWRLRELGLHLDSLPQSESLFALSNGHIGLRGNLDEGEPNALPGTYLNGLYESRPLPYGETGYGFPESGETVINVTNGKVMRLLVDDEPFDIRYGELEQHERCLDLRAGTLTRTALWTSPAGQRVRVRTTRIVSLTHRSIVAIHYEVEAVDEEARVVVQSELVTNEELPSASNDPRVAAVLAAPLASEEYASYSPTSAYLIHRTKVSGLRVATIMDHEVSAPTRVDAEMEVRPDLARYSVTCRLKPGETLSVTKFVAYGWSGSRSLPALRDQVAAGLAAVRQTGWDELLAEQRAYLDDFWSRADVEIGGDSELQQAIRFALFHILQSSARAERRPIPAKGLTGTGYDGHTFWDTEMFVLPVLTHTVPHAAQDALRWRLSTLAKAKERAATLGLEGAAFPWRTISGDECSGYWPASTAAFHINADIADAAIRHVAATNDRAFEESVVVELLVETARLWASLGHHDPQGRFHIDGVTGPDEYSALGNDNTYTNLMAQRNLRGAADACGRHVKRARTLGVTPEEVARWRLAADAMVMHRDPAIGVVAQAENYTRLQEWDFAKTGPDCYPLLLHFPYFELYRQQVVKQADLVLAMHTCPDSFNAAEKLTSFDYYERLTVRDSSLSACTQAVVAAEVGHLDLAHDYAVEAALMDLANLEHNTSDGLHMASLAGSWLAMVHGFGGLRDHTDQLQFAPRLPGGLTRLAFTVTRSGARLIVEVTGQQATYCLLDGEDPMTIRHYGEELELAPGQVVAREIKPGPVLPRPEQPPYRAPYDRSGVPPHHDGGVGGGS